MRTNMMLHAALASVFVVPAVTLTGREGGGLEDALTRTIEAIESLSGLRTQLAGPETKDASNADVGSELAPLDLEEAVSFVLAATEAPRRDGPEQDRVLATLRRDVSRLQMVLDELTSRTPRPASGGSTAGPGSLPPLPDDTGPGATTRATPTITTGLDDQARSDLLNIQPPVMEPEDLDRASRPAQPRTNEGESFTADALRLGHAYYRAGRYTEGLVILSKQTGSVEARYWAARCLEHLGRYDEAAAAYEEVVANEDAGYLADRAQSDLLFLTWKRDFSRRVDGPVQGRGERTGG